MKTVWRRNRPWGRCKVCDGIGFFTEPDELGLPTPAARRGHDAEVCKWCGGWGSHGISRIPKAWYLFVWLPLKLFLGIPYMIWRWEQNEKEWYEIIKHIKIKEK
jgi:hypothetical protein